MSYELEINIAEDNQIKAMFLSGVLFAFSITLFYTRPLPTFQILCVLLSIFGVIEYLLWVNWPQRLKKFHEFCNSLYEKQDQISVIKSNRDDALRRSE